LLLTLVVILTDTSNRMLRSRCTVILGIGIYKNTTPIHANTKLFPYGDTQPIWLTETCMWIAVSPSCPGEPYSLITWLKLPLWLSHFSSQLQDCVR